MKNRVGEKWNNLTIIKFDRGEKKFQGGYRYYWFCECICGTIKSIMYGNLQSGSVKSCGCLKSELISNTNTTHGHTKKKNISPEFNSWNGMFYRCYNTNCDSYKYYGGRGITVCDRWLNSFKNFLEDMGFKPDKSYSIDRINNDLGYYKENCRWATPAEQSNNRRGHKPRTANIKLKPEDVIAIWYSLDTYPNLAAKFGVHTATISDIKCRKRRTSITSTLKLPSNIL